MVPVIAVVQDPVIGVHSGIEPKSTRLEHAASVARHELRSGEGTQITVTGAVDKDLRLQPL